VSWRDEVEMRAGLRHDDRLRREVEDRVAARDSRRDCVGVAQVALGELDLGADAEQVERRSSGSP